MGKNNVHYLLAFCLAVFGAYSAGAQGQVDPKAHSEIFEEKLVKYGLSKSGIDGDYEIVVADNPDIVENTATAKKAQYHDLLREDIAVRKRFVDLLTGFSEMRPCLTRTSLSEEGIVRQIAHMKTEIVRTENYLKQNGG